MDNYCYKCGLEAKDGICDGCNDHTVPLIPSRTRGREVKDKQLGPKGVAVLMVAPNQNGLDSMFFCEMEVSLPPDWDDQVIKKVGQNLDGMFKGARASWRSFGGHRSLLRMNGLRSEGRCEWCRAFRKSMHNLSKEKDAPFNTDCLCRY